MNQNPLFQLSQISVIDVSGEDAATIVNNVTTNDVRSLQNGFGLETFVTDVRGKMLGHVLAYQLAGTIRLIGPAGQSEQIVQHLDRYTIREDATPEIRDANYVAMVAPPPIAASIANDLADSTRLKMVPFSLGKAVVQVYGSGWLGKGTGLLLLESDDLQHVAVSIQSKFQVELADEVSFHNARVAARFPWFGIDVNETNLPQEADRDDAAISFTKGCYLGQETVARLDAMGQVQKKLVLWSIRNGVPQIGDALKVDEKTVGRLTSVALNEDGTAIAIGFARRSHFDVGSVAFGQVKPVSQAMNSEGNESTDKLSEDHAPYAEGANDSTSVDAVQNDESVANSRFVATVI